MIKIDMEYKTVEEFKKSVMKKFKNNKLEQFDEEVKSKLKDYDGRINLESLIDIDFKEIKKIKEFIDKDGIKFNFNGKDLYKKIDSETKIKYIKNLNISVCPYCNRNYIKNFKIRNKGWAVTAELDHFFPKELYPCFAISIYNLIPCCHICNHRKSQKEEEIYYPFEESFSHNIQFYYIPRDVNFLYNEEKIDLDYGILNKEEEGKVKNNMDIFKIKELYEGHKDLILELIQKSQIYTESYIDELLQNYQGKVFNNREDLLRLIIGVYVDEKDINKRPLSKLLMDISKSLGLLY